MSRFKGATWWTLAVAIAGIVGCGDNQDPEGALELWNQLQKLDYRNFARAPGYPSRQKSNAPHGDKVDIYVNPVLDDALNSGGSLSEWPVGSLIIKDGFDDDGDHELVAVMEKRDSGWYWAEYFDFETGEARFSGKPDLCLGCHKSGADYIRAFGFPSTM